jgi:hypothetical protein
MKQKEIALQALNLAKDILTEQFQNSRIAVENNYYAERNQNEKDFKPAPLYPELAAPTTDEILAEATKLINFIG